MLSPRRIAAMSPSSALGEALSEALLEGVPAATGVSFHSGRVRRGDIFFALPGEHEHGIRYADAALSAGAAFVVSDAPHPRGVRVADPGGVLLELGREARAALRGPVVGVTGSAGKTSTKAFLCAALGVPNSPGNFNTPLALAQILVEAWLSGRVNEPLVLELGIDHIGEMATLVELTRPTHALLTLVAESHLSGLGSVEGVAREKGRLVEAAEVAFVSAQAAPLLSAERREKSRVYGLIGEEADITGRIVETTPEGQTLEVSGVRFSLPHPGAAMARNAVGALTLASHLGLPLEEAATRLATVTLEPGRLQIHALPNFTLIDDTYNSSPAALRAALEVLKTMPGPRTAVLGDMLELGTASEELHRAVGRETRGLDAVLTVGSEARFITAENSHAQHFETVEEAQNHLSTLNLTGTVLVKASRGMRLERLVTLLKNREAVA